MGELVIWGEIVAGSTLGPVMAGSGLEIGRWMPGPRWRCIGIRHARIAKPDRLTSSRSAKVGNTPFYTVPLQKSRLVGWPYNILVRDGDAMR